jgi:hypothetical protein
LLDDKLMDPETAIDNFHLDEHEEREYIKMLNRNIRNDGHKKNPILAKEFLDVKKNVIKNGFVDIDEYFTKTVMAHISQDEKNRRKKFQKPGEVSSDDSVDKKHKKEQKDLDSFEWDIYKKQTIDKKEAQSRREHDKDDKNKSDKKHKKKNLSPIEFDRLVKGYAYFLHEQQYDHHEMGFAKKFVTAKKKENLVDDISSKAKYEPPVPKLASRNEFILETTVIYLVII